jgi:hypothetical protein
MTENMRNNKEDMAAQAGGTKLILVLGIVAAFAIGVYFLLDSNRTFPVALKTLETEPEKETVPEETAPAQDQPTGELYGWKIYDRGNGFEFEYPEGFAVQDGTDAEEGTVFLWTEEGYEKHLAGGTAAAPYLWIDTVPLAKRQTLASYLRAQKDIQQAENVTVGETQFVRGQEVANGTYVYFLGGKSNVIRVHTPQEKDDPSLAQFLARVRLTGK